LRNGAYWRISVAETAFLLMFIHALTKTTVIYLSDGLKSHKTVFIDQLISVSIELGEE